MRLGLRGAVALTLVAGAVLPGGGGGAGDFGGRVGAAPASAAPACERAAAARAGRWYVTNPPLPAHSTAHQALHGDLRRLRAAAVDPADPRVVVVTDGERVTRSDDGGCSWRQVWALPADPEPGEAGRDLAEITGLDVAHAGGRSRVLLAVAGNGWGTAYGVNTYLIRSDDGRTGWTRTAIVTAPYDHQQGFWPPLVHSAGTAVYAAVPGPLGVVAYVRSADGGRTWTAPSSLVDPGAPTRMTGFAVNPYDPEEVWEWGGTRSKAGDTMTGLRRSSDGGHTWAAIDPWAIFADARPAWSTADVAWPRRYGPARVLIFGGTASASGDYPPVATWSGNGGTTFRQVVPATRLSLLHAAVTHLPSGDAFVVTENGTAFTIRCAARPPGAADWRALPRAPKPPAASWSVLGPDLARATATTPSVVAVSTTTHLQLLTVAR